ncbi:unnamed protein product [Schistosoma rodhaini]|nr:unnamed protein product [Schistosoma rodhaini]
MIDQSQSCPSCRSSKYSNPQLKLMVNVCGHSLCENCVEVLFVRGSGLCAQCKTPIRKNNFRYQLFEDPLVQKEIDIRKKLLSDFNKREDDFDCLEEYNLYLEKIEDLIYNLTNDISVEETKRYIENYKKENKEIIKKNRTKPSSSMAFYDSELERESILREKREREEEEEGGTLKGLENTRGSDDPNGPMTTESEGERRKNNIPPTPRTNMLIPPTSAFGRRAPATFIPPSVYAPPSYIPPPTQALGHAPSSAFPVRPIVTPVSGFMAPPSMLPVAPPTGSLSNNWISGTHHMIHLPPTASLRKQQDTVLIPSQNTYLSKSPMTSKINHMNEQFPCTEKYSELKEVLKPCGKLPPTNDIKLDRSYFKRKVPMIFVGVQCDKHLKTSLEKLRPFFCPFIRLPKISKTYRDPNGSLRKLMLVQMPEPDNILQFITDLNQWNVDLPKDYPNLQPVDLSVPKLPECLDNVKAENSLNDEAFKKVSVIEEEINLLENMVTSPCLVNISVGYENFTFEQVIKELLPDFILPITGFTIIGHVMQFNLKTEALPYRHIIGQVALDKIPNIRTVIHKVSNIESAYRTFEMELLAGVPDYITSMRENNMTFHLDISKVYCNPRLGTEHTRVVNSLRPPLPNNDPFLTPRPIPGDRVVVYDVFAGIGPFSIPASRAGCHVLANDLNPDSFIWLKKNVAQNSSRKHPLKNIICYNMDGREFIREILLPHYRKYGSSDKIESTDCDSISSSIDRFVVIMNLPQLAIDFLDAFVPPLNCINSSNIITDNNSDNVTANLNDSSPIHQKFIKPLYIYCYCFMRRNIESEENIKIRLAKALNTNITDLFQFVNSTPNNETVNNNLNIEQTNDQCFIINWHYRFVRNVAPFKDMYCAEFELYLPKLWLFYDYSNPTVKRSRTTENELIE